MRHAGGAALDIDHRLTPPRSPQTNGMVERLNGRIEEVLQSHPFRSGEVLEATLLRYVWLYTQPLLQSALGSKTPLQAMKGWRKLKLELVRMTCPLKSGPILVLVLQRFS